MAFGPDNVTSEHKDCETEHYKTPERDRLPVQAIGFTGHRIGLWFLPGTRLLHQSAVSLCMLIGHKHLAFWESFVVWVMR